MARLSTRCRATCRREIRAAMHIGRAQQWLEPRPSTSPPDERFVRRDFFWRHVAVSWCWFTERATAAPIIPNKEPPNHAEISVYHDGKCYVHDTLPHMLYPRPIAARMATKTPITITTPPAIRKNQNLPASVLVQDHSDKPDPHSDAAYQQDTDPDQKNFIEPLHHILCQTMALALSRAVFKAATISLPSIAVKNAAKVIPTPFNIVASSCCINRS